MKRWTRVVKNGRVVPNGKHGNRQMMWNRLCEYEQTLLSPAEVEAVKAENKRLSAENQLLNARLDEYRQAEQEGRLVRREKSEYEFFDDAVMVYPNADEEIEPEDHAGVCVVKCKKCGWNMFGDGWWEHEYLNNTKSEQVPNFCAHCGAEFTEESARAALKKDTHE